MCWSHTFTKQYLFKSMLLYYLIYQSFNNGEISKCNGAYLKSLDGKPAWKYYIILRSDKSSRNSVQRWNSVLSSRVYLLRVRRFKLTFTALFVIPGSLNIKTQFRACRRYRIFVCVQPEAVLFNFSLNSPAVNFAFCKTVGNLKKKTLKKKF